MTNLEFRDDIFESAKAGLMTIGYRENLFRSNYQFADIFSLGDPIRDIELAVFAQEPPSYRNACFGLIRDTGDSGLAERVESYRALGAPQFLVVQPKTRTVNRWKMTAEGKPIFIEQIDALNIGAAIIERKFEWNPEMMLRARSISPRRVSTQLDFFDLGLMPLIESETQQKLDGLLRNVLSSSVKLYLERYHNQPDYQKLIHLIFRFIAAKQLADRNHPGGNWNNSNPTIVIQEIEKYYFRNVQSEPVLEDIEVQQMAWDQIREAFHFSNVSVETLAYIYENTLVSSETRKQYDVHATPPSVAEYMVQSLPFEDLAPEERTVFELFSGHAPFLTAALGRLKSLLPPDTDSNIRHDYLVRMLSGMEIDTFAREVARNSLILADYPNPDGWQLINGNVFTSQRLEQLLKKASVILCNPPFGDFNKDERSQRSGLAPNKAVEALRLALKYSPKMLGFILPRVFVNGPKFRLERQKMAELYDEIEITSLPRNAFQHSDVETVLVLAHGVRSTHSRLKVAAIRSADYAEFLRTGCNSWQMEVPIQDPQHQEAQSFWYEPVQAVLNELFYLPRLKSVAEIHRGIEYNFPIKGSLNKVVSDQPKPNYLPGLYNTTEGFEPYFLNPTKYLNMAPELMLYKAYLLPWNRPKVIASASRLLSEGWVIGAGIDHTGIVAYHAFHGIWPVQKFPLEVIAAILNGPVANAYLNVFRTSRGNYIQNIKTIPIPNFNDKQIVRITSLVNEYIKYRQIWLEKTMDESRVANQCLEIIHEVDGEVLSAYNLSPRSERQLLNYFAGLKRPGPVKFERYNPDDFNQAIPWRTYISSNFRNSSAKATLKRLPVLNDPVISEMLQDLDL